MKKEHIAVRIPCGWSITPQLSAALCYLKEASYDPAMPYWFSVGYVINVRPADFARNEIVKEFLKTDATRLWMIDSDIMPHPNAGSILKIDADIAGGLYPLWGQMNGKESKPEIQWTVYDWNEKAQSYNPQSIRDHGVYDCDALGTGMMVIRRAVLEDERMRFNPEWFNYKDDRQELGPDDPPPVFRENHKPNGQFDATEDIDFCYRAKANGYSLKADHAVKCGHVKTANIMSVMDFALAAYGKGFVEGADASSEGRIVLAS